MFIVVVKEELSVSMWLKHPTKTRNGHMIYFICNMPHEWKSERRNLAIRSDPVIANPHILGLSQQHDWLLYVTQGDTNKGGYESCYYDTQT